MSEPVTCERFGERVLDLAYGELDEAGAAALREHAAGCARCGAELASIEGVRRAAHRLRDLSPPPAVRVGLVAEAERAARPWYLRSWGWLSARPLHAVGALAMAAGALLTLRQVADVHTLMEDARRPLSWSAAPAAPAADEVAEPSAGVPAVPAPERRARLLAEEEAATAPGHAALAEEQAETHGAGRAGPAPPEQKLRAHDERALPRSLPAPARRASRPDREAAAAKSAAGPAGAAPSGGAAERDVVAAERAEVRVESARGAALRLEAEPAPRARFAQPPPAPSARSAPAAPAEDALVDLWEERTSRKERGYREAPPAAAAPLPASPADLIANADRARARGDCRAAADLYASFLRVAPDHPRRREAQDRRLDCLDRLGRCDDLARLGAADRAASCRRARAQRAAPAAAEPAEPAPER